MSQKLKTKLEKFIFFLNLEVRYKLVKQVMMSVSLGGRVDRYDFAVIISKGPPNM